ncbi:MAG: hypothetical protein KatS3mg108_0525 [Isosphaeraceae bacterium]|jgi:hypothetical protein|nr:MAG: hypothetical protein KatS3mg108_0525 [Isosphaeraceae bacterium]
MTLIQIGNLTLNADRLAAVVDQEELGLRLILDSGRELSILDASEAQALRTWLETHGSRLD